LRSSEKLIGRIPVSSRKSIHFFPGDGGPFIEAARFAADRADILEDDFGGAALPVLTVW
jgi:hypothetical protein